MRPITATALSLLVLAQGAAAQNEAALRAAFEGRTVVVKVDMPATSRGIDVFPQEAMPIDFREVAERLKDDGTALRIGQQVMITKVAVKGDSHIEFQLGGGGWGTFGDYVAAPTSASVVEAGESEEEKSLRQQIRTTSDRDEKRRLERRLNDLRAARERENARAAAEAKQANEAQETNMRVRRAESGSRFNVRYRSGIPAEALTPEGMRRALAGYVDFGDVPAATPPTDQAGGGLAAIRKGLLLEQVEAILGPAVTAEQAQEGRLTVLHRTYAKDGMNVSATFVSGVLIDFAITPR